MTDQTQQDQSPNRKLAEEATAVMQTALKDILEKFGSETAQASVFLYNQLTLDAIKDELISASANGAKNPEESIKYIESLLSGFNKMQSVLLTSYVEAVKVPESVDLDEAFNMTDKAFEGAQEMIAKAKAAAKEAANDEQLAA